LIGDIPELLTLEADQLRDGHIAIGKRVKERLNKRNLGRRRPPESRDGHGQADRSSLNTVTTRDWVGSSQGLLQLHVMPFAGFRAGRVTEVEGVAIGNVPTFRSLASVGNHRKCQCGVRRIGGDCDGVNKHGGGLSC